MKKYIFTLLSIFCIVSCDIQTSDFFRSYINTYFVTESITLKNGQNKLYLCLYPSNTNTKTYNWKSTGEKKDIYDSLCIRNNDMTFNRTVQYVEYPHWGNNYMAEYIDSIHIVSNSDFDTNHPAGTLLNDIITLKWQTIKNFIDNEYKWLDGKTGIAEGTLLSNREVQLSALQPNDLILIFNSTIEFDFNKTPTNSKTHYFTVTVFFDTGEKLSSNIEKTWE